MIIKIPRKKIILLAIVICAIVGGAILRRASITANELIARGDLVDGVITNMSEMPKVKLGTKFRGTGVYDKNCVKVGVVPETGNPLVDCHAGIATKEYGLIDFKHVHDYYQNPCIVENDELVIEILDSKGNAKVQRISKAPKEPTQETERMSI